MAGLLVALQAASWPLLCLRASSNLHSKSLRSVLRAPLGVPLMMVPGQVPVIPAIPPPASHAQGI
eukprot:1713314-Heterocapsa_arctica.AAC.1